jgi:hypothetical protein
MHFWISWWLTARYKASEQSPRLGDVTLIVMNDMPCAKGAWNSD